MSGVESKKEEKKILINAQALSVGYKNHKVVCDVNFEVRQGEILTLVGPNGEGKSTLLKSIAGYINKLGGKIFLLDKDMASLNAAETARKMSVMLTGKTDPELMTVRDVVSVGRYPYTGRLGLLSKKDNEKIDEAMALTDIEELGDRPFNEISDGQRQRVLLSRALCQEPEVLLLDEPTSFLDIRHKLKLIAILKRWIKKENMAVIMSLHELELAGRVSDKLLCIKDGKIDRYGAPKDIFNTDYIVRLFDIDEEECMEAIGTSVQNIL